MGVRETSLLAYRGIDLLKSEADLMRLVHLHYSRAAQFTRKELSAKTGWEINRICGRVNALVQKGYLTEYEQTRDGGHLLSIKPAAPPIPSSGLLLPPERAGAAEPDEQLITTWDSKGKEFQYVAVGRRT